MMANQKQISVFVFSLTLSITAFASTNEWQRFDSSNRFSVMYPGAWFRISASTDRLQLLSSKGGAEGIVIKRGQAEITVTEAQDSSTKTLTQVIDYYTQGVLVLSRKHIPGETGKQGCSDLEEVTSKEQAIPSADSPIRVPYIINTDLFCEINGRKIVTLLRNWEGDKRQEEYQEVALRIAKGIRLTQY